MGIESNVPNIPDVYYPHDFPERTLTGAELIDHHDELEGAPATLVGRVVGVRQHKQVTFFDVRDESGSAQVITEPEESDTGLAFGSGDIVAAEGTVGKSGSGQPSLLATNVTILSKALQGVPRGPLSSQTRRENRFLDLLTNDGARNALITRSHITRSIRDYLGNQGLIEVETPIVNTFYNGGVARPFKTHLNGLGRPGFLRVTSELYLKQLIVSGLEGVYELSKQFRNEGLGAIYSPEFTVCEIYRAYKQQEWIMSTVEEMTAMAGEVAAAHPPLDPTQRADFSRPWERITMHDAVCRALGDLGMEADSRDSIIEHAHEAGIEGDYPQALLGLFKRCTEATLRRPTFITNLPEPLTPMAKRDPQDPSTVNKVMFYANGFQLGDGCYEENNPIKQRGNFERQYAQHAADGFPQYPRDPDFMNALDHGMPPMSGIAIGYDRMLMAAIGASNIRDVMAFRPRK